MRIGFLKTKWIIIFFFFVGCTKESSKIDSLDQPVLMIGDIKYTVKDLSHDLALRLIRYDLFVIKNQKFIDLVKNRLISDVILKKLIVLDKDQLGIQVSEDEINREFKKIKQDYPDEFAFKEALIKAHLTEEIFKKYLEEYLIVEKFFLNLQSQIKDPTEQECMEVYKTNTEDYLLPEKVLIRQIVVKEKHQAEEILNELQKRKFSFEELAKNFSIGPEGQTKEGLVGWIDEGQSDIFKLAFKLKVGKISSIIESPYGYHILKLEAREPRKKLSFEAAKPRIKQKLIADQEQGLFLKWLDEKLRKTKIKKDSKLLNLLKIETKGS